MARVDEDSYRTCHSHHQYTGGANRIYSLLWEGEGLAFLAWIVVSSEMVMVQSHLHLSPLSEGCGHLHTHVLWLTRVVTCHHKLAHPLPLLLGTWFS